MRDVPSIGAENILGLGKYDFSKEKFVSREFFEKMKRGHINNCDVLLYKDGAKIGRKSMFRDNFPHSECCINEHVFILRTNEKCGQAYLFFWLDQPDITAGIINLNANAAQPGINQEDVKGLPILLPDRKLLDLFDEFVEPLLAKLFNLAKKNQVLRRTPDLLLPKLISGELDVSELEIETGGIVNG
jgi:type I restriction enzyme S subunit